MNLINTTLGSTINLPRIVTRAKNSIAFMLFEFKVQLAQ